MSDEPPAGGRLPPHGAARPLGRRPLPPRFEAVVAVIVGALVVVAIVLAAAVVMKDGAEARQAASAATTYTPAPLGSLGATPPVVVVIGDASSDAASAAVPAGDFWTAQVDASLGVDLVVLADDRSAWVDATDSGPTFVQQAARVPSDADLVIFFGGLRDADTSAARVSSAVADAVAVVQQQASSARVLVVAPPTTGAGSTAALRRTLRAAAASAEAAYADPVSLGWLPSGAGDGSTLDTDDEGRIARRMSELIGKDA